MNSSSETTSGGARADKTGNSLENFVEDILIRNGYTEFVGPKKQVFIGRHMTGGKQYAKQPWCGQTIYGTDRRCDLLVMNKEQFPDGLIIECKWQESTGSVDEKYPFLVHNIAKTGVPSIILIDGQGYKRQALEWLKAQVAPERFLIGVYTMQEFQKQINKGFLG